MPLIQLIETPGSGAEVYAQLMDAVGTSRMDRTLFDCANHIHRVDEIFGFTLDADAPPRPIGWIGARADAAARVSLYAERFYRLDPLIRDLRHAPRKGAVFLRSTRATAISDEEYRWYCYDLPRLEEKISVARPTENGWNILNFYRRDPCRPDQVAELATFGMFALAAIAKHGHLLSLKEVVPVASDPADRVAQQLRHRFPGLSQREAQVCASSLLGAKSPDIGRRLGVAPSTVLTYRRRAYERLGIRSANELVVHLLA